MKLRLLIFVFIIIASCNSNVGIVEKTKFDYKIIKFDFLLSSDSIPKKGHIILGEIPFSLTNMSNDTLYFISTFCNGPSYFLKSDTSKVEFFQLFSCVADGPVVEKILPNSTLFFKSGLNNKYALNEIKVGFHFIPVDKRAAGKSTMGKFLKDFKNEGKVLWVTKKF